MLSQPWCDGDSEQKPWLLLARPSRQMLTYRRPLLQDAPGNGGTLLDRLKVVLPSRVRGGAVEIKDNHLLISSLRLFFFFFSFLSSSFISGGIFSCQGRV